MVYMKRGYTEKARKALKIWAWIVGAVMFLNIGATIACWSMPFGWTGGITSALLIALFFYLLVSGLRAEQYLRLEACVARGGAGELPAEIVRRYLEGGLKYVLSGYSFECYVDAEGKLLCYAHASRGGLVQNVRLYASYAQYFISPRAAADITARNVPSREVRSFGYAELGSRPTPEEVLGRCAEEFARYAPEYYDESSK